MRQAGYTFSPPRGPCTDPADGKHTSPAIAQTPPPPVKPIINGRTHDDLPKGLQRRKTRIPVTVPSQAQSVDIFSGLVTVASSRLGDVAFFQPSDFTGRENQSYLPSTAGGYGGAGTTRCKAAQLGRELMTHIIRNGRSFRTAEPRGDTRQICLPAGLKGKTLTAGMYWLTMWQARIDCIPANPAPSPPPRPSDYLSPIIFILERKKGPQFQFRIRRDGPAGPISPAGKKGAGPDKKAPSSS